MSFLTTIESSFITNEAWVLGVITQAKAGILVLEKDVAAGIRWVVAHAPQLTADIQSITMVAQVVGAGNPEVAIAIGAANTAVAALNAFAKASNAGAATPAALIDGYVAVQAAVAAHATAAIAAVSVPAPATAAAAAS